MPTRFWTHECCESDVGTMSAAQNCPKCGKAGVLAGWHYERLEAMAIYQNQYGLKPTGPHRDLATRLIGEFRAQCVDCDGRGLLDATKDLGFTICRLCRGSGSLLQIDATEFDAIRSAVLASYPSAGVDFRIPNVISATLILDEKENVVREVKRPEKEGR
jgi:hypothetical protein